jgi:hypothetical protein
MPPRGKASNEEARLVILPPGYKRKLEKGVKSVSEPASDVLTDTSDNEDDET